MPFSLICKGRRQQHSPLVPTLFQFNPKQLLQEHQVRQYFLGPNLCLKDLGSGLSFTRLNSRNVYKMSCRTRQSWLAEPHLPGFTFHTGNPHHLEPWASAERGAEPHILSLRHPDKNSCETILPRSSGTQHGSREASTH